MNPTCRKCGSHLLKRVHFTMQVWGNPFRRKARCRVCSAINYARPRG